MRMWKQCFWALTISSVAVFSAFGTQNARPQSNDLFRELGEVVRPSQGAGPKIIQSRTVTLEDSALLSRASVRFNMFPDASFSGAPDAAVSGQDSSIVGRLTDVPGGSFTIVRSGGRLFAAVHAIGREFSIDPLPNGRYEVVEWDASEPLRCGTVSAQLNRRRTLRNLPQEARPPRPLREADGREIAVLVVYSDGVAADNTAEHLRGIVERAIADGNQIMRNSGLDLTLRLVGLEHVPFDESNLASDLDRITVGPVTARLRNERGADQVTLMTRFDGIYWGIAWLLQDLSEPRGPMAYAVVAQDLFRSGYVFAHELGHSLGCQHDRANSYNSAGVFMPGLYNFSHGQWYIPSDGRKYGTIMSYEGRRIPYFSNPAVFYPPGLSDNATGHSTRNNAETIRRSKRFVANYR